MSAPPTATMPHHPSSNDGCPSPTLERLRGRWLCRVTGSESGVTALGVLELLHAGSYLVGSAVAVRKHPAVLPTGAGEPDSGATLEGSVFGTVRGQEIVFWVTDRSGSSVWVLEGRLDSTDKKITGSASYTHAERASEPPREGQFTLALL